MAACLRGGCRAPAEDGVEAGAEEEARIGSSSAVQRSAAPGRVADHYTFGRTLGTGGYAVVKAATHVHTGERAAIKILKLPAVGESGLAQEGTRQRTPRESERFYSGGVDKSDLMFEDIANEIQILKSLDHPAVLHLHAHYVSEHGDKVYLVTELLEGGELLDALLDRGNYSETDAVTIMRPVLQGLAYLHSRGVTHRDLKLENLLLADAQDLSSVRIADFGLAKSAFSGGGGDRLGAGGICGTPSYLAPEIVAGQRYTPAVDCWAAGVCLYILLSGVVPFNWTDRPGADLRELFDRISAGAFSLDGVQWDGVSDDAKDLVRGLMCTSVPQRLTAKRALSHRWFTAQLASTTPLAHLAAAQAKLRAFAASLRLPVLRFRAGEYVVRRGERASDVYLIRSGSCECLREPSGGGILRVATVGEGDFVGRTMALDMQGNALDLDTLEEEVEEAPPPLEAHGRRSGAQQAPLNAPSQVSGDTLSARRPSGVCVRALTDVEVLVMGRSLVQDALATKDPAVQTEVLSVRHQLKSTSQSDGQGKGLVAPRSARRGAAGPGTLFCGMDHFVVELSHGLESWSNGVARWTNDALHGRF